MEAQARAQKYAVETELAPQELEVDKLRVATVNIKDGSQDDKEFEKRVRIADLMLKEKKLELDREKSQAKPQESEAEKAFLARMTNAQ